MSYGRKRMSFLDRLRFRHERLARDESGQVLLLTALMVLALAMCVAMILPTGQVVAAKIQAQNAADAAAMTATTWMCRGANYLQGCNGFFWDVDGIMVVVIEGITYYYIAKIAEDASDFFTWIMIPIHWFEGRGKIAKGVKAQKAMSASITGAAVMGAELTPMLAFSHANNVARKNGADVIQASDFTALRKNLPGVPAGLTESAYNTAFDEMRKWLKDGEFSQGILNWLRERGVHLEWGIGCILEHIIPKPHGDIPADKFPPYAWPVNPELNPENSMAFAEGKTAGGFGMTSPLCAEFWWPFALCLFFIKFVSWSDKYYESKNVDVPITFMCAKSTGKSFMLDSLLTSKSKQAAGEPLMPRVYAMGSAKMTGDKLYIAGQSSTIYISTPIFAIPIWPFPLVRLFINGYGGSFKNEMTPVKALDHSGSEMMIYH